jgi:hypothetical protein
LTAAKEGRKQGRRRENAAIAAHRPNPDGYYERDTERRSAAEIRE